MTSYNSNQNTCIKCKEEIKLSKESYTWHITSGEKYHHVCKNEALKKAGAL